MNAITASADVLHSRLEGSKPEHRLAAGLMRLLLTPAITYADRQRLRASVQALATIHDHALRDIGIERGQINAALLLGR
jgi:uncharacterized protein YjiS (DUF1127 family)